MSLGFRESEHERGEKGSVKYSDLVRAVGFLTTATRALKHMKELGLVYKRALKGFKARKGLN